MMEGALTGKTGFTNKAGYCYVGALERDGRTFVVALLACGWPNNKTYKWSDTRKLMQYGMDNYFYRSFLEKGVAFDESLLKPIPVQNGQTARLGAEAFVAARVAGVNGGKKLDGLLMRADEDISVQYIIEESLTAPVAENMPIGSVVYKVGDTVYRTETIVTAEEKGAVDSEWCLRQILDRFLLP